MPVDQAEILKEAVETLRADATLIALLGEIEGQPGEARVWNHVPQDESKPYVVVSWQPDEDWDTKDSRGFDGSLDHEAVSIHHGDRNVLRIADAVIAAYTANPLSLASGRIVCFDYQSGSVPVQVFETHQIAFSFNVLVDADGIGGAPIPPPLAASLSPYDFLWWPQRVYSSAKSFDPTGGPFGKAFSSVQMEGLAIWVPRTVTIDALVVRFGEHTGGPPTFSPVDYPAGSILRVGIYSNDDLVAGFYPKTKEVDADFDLTTLNPHGGNIEEIVIPIPETSLAGGKYHWVIIYHNVTDEQVKVERSTEVDFAQAGGAGFGPFFIRGVNAQQFPFAVLPVTFPFLGLGFESANVSPAPPYIGVRKK